MPRHKADDALLHLLKIAQGLGHPQHHAGVAHRMHRHGGGGHNKAFAGRNRQRDADGMPAAQHQRCAGLADAGDQLRQSEPGFHIAAHGIQDDQQPLNGGVLLNIHQLGDHMLILGAFLVIRSQAVALNGADHRQAINGMAALGGGHNAAVRDQVMFQPHALHILGVLGSMGGGLLFWGTVWHSGGPFLPTKSVRRAVQNPAIP